METNNYSMSSMSMLDQELKSPMPQVIQEQDIFSNQYIVVRDSLQRQQKQQQIQQVANDFSISTAKTAGGGEGILDGSASYLSKLHTQSLNSFDNETFIRHSDIVDPFRIKIDFLRDFKNSLKLLSDESYCLYVDCLEKDTSRMNVAKLATRKFADPSQLDELMKEKNSKQVQSMLNEIGKDREKQEKTMQLDDFNFQVYLEINLIQNGKMVKPKIYTGVKYGFELDEIIELPINVSDLAPLSSIAISIYNMDSFEEKPIASTVLDIFDSRRCLRQGTWNLQLHLGSNPDPSLKCRTPSLTEHHTCTQINNCLRLIQNWRKKLSVNPSWIDKQSFLALSDKLYALYMDQPMSNSKSFLEVSLPDYGRTVIFMEKNNTLIRKKCQFPPNLIAGYANYMTKAHFIKSQGGNLIALDSLDQSYNNQDEQKKEAGSLAAYEDFYKSVKLANATKRYDKAAVAEIQEEDTITTKIQKSLQICKFHDPLVMRTDYEYGERNNPINDKFYILTRNVNSVSASQLKPTIEEQIEIDRIAEIPMFQVLNEEKKDRLWKFRHSLQSKKELLPKFLVSVQWDSQVQRDIAIKLMKEWTEIDIEQALPLLSGLFCLNGVMNHMSVCQSTSDDVQKRFKEVRAHAVNCLKKISDQKLDLYMLQIIQALRYEDFQDSQGRVRTGLKDFLIDRAIKCESIAHNMYWYLMLEAENDNNLEAVRNYYQQFLEDFVETLEEQTPNVFQCLSQAIALRVRLLNLSTHIKGLKVKIDQKSSKLREILQTSDENLSQFNLMHLENGMTLSHEPSIKVYGVKPNQCFVFKSAVQPMKLTFSARKFHQGWKESDELPKLFDYSLVVKNGDDMRQDQLILNLFNLMDRIWIDVALDFQFTCYKVLAHSKNDGIMEFVEGSSTVQSALQGHNASMLGFLIHQAKNAEGVIDQDKQKEIQQTYIKSCAGYAVATYLLAIGDRHLENLMITAKGRMFHLDFGFILGVNPKGKDRWVPPIRLNKPMVMGFGEDGIKSAGYKEFRDKTIDAFLFLRNSKHLILNMMMLMIDASIPNLPFADYQRILSKMNERFLPDCEPEEARRRFTEIIQESVEASMAEVYEWFHVVVGRFK